MNKNIESCNLYEIKTVKILGIFKYVHVYALLNNYHRGQTSSGYKRSCAGYKRYLALNTNVPYGILQ